MVHVIEVVAFGFLVFVFLGAYSIVAVSFDDCEWEEEETKSRWTLRQAEPSDN